MNIQLGRDICNYLDIENEREWIVTNGIGGYASGTISGILTRRYHGLLVAAMHPPLGRTLILSKLDETALYNGSKYPLFSNLWADGTIDPHGYRNIESFALEGTVPVWRFSCGYALLEKRLWMNRGSNTTYIQYNLKRANHSLDLEIKVFVNYRDYHSITNHGNWFVSSQRIPNGLCIRAFDNSQPFYLFTGKCEVHLINEWYCGFNLPVERSRGLDHIEDHLCAVIFNITLAPSDVFTIIASTEQTPELNGNDSLKSQHQYENKLIEQFRKSGKNKNLERADYPQWISRLALSADQFIVSRPVPGKPDGKTIIAGYHWFSDWGRDAMISLPGLTLSTGRFDDALAILRTFSNYVHKGIIPNRFPDAKQSPEYNTVDASLWYIEAVRSYYDVTGDSDFLIEIFPVLTDIIYWYISGTVYDIHVDHSDGLLYAGNKSTQLTWMDAKVYDKAITPRVGKPVEINALWYNALLTMSRIADTLNKSSRDYDKLSKLVFKGFRRFWNEKTGYCYDVIDGPDGNDPTLRPNQILAVSLDQSPLSDAEQKGVVDICSFNLCTSYGLRSLSPHHEQYKGNYSGNQQHRDNAYHQGTVWGWLLGHFALAFLRVYKDTAKAKEFLEPMLQHLNSYGIGTLGEIFDGDPPLTPRGCIAQAWTVGEILRAWTEIDEIEITNCKKPKKFKH